MKKQVILTLEYPFTIYDDKDDFDKEELATLEESLEDDMSAQCDSLGQSFFQSDIDTSEMEVVGYRLIEIEPKRRKK